MYLIDGDVGFTYIYKTMNTVTFLFVDVVELCP